MTSMESVLTSRKSERLISSHWIRTATPSSSSSASGAMAVGPPGSSAATTPTRSPYG